MKTFFATIVAAFATIVAAFALTACHHGDRGVVVPDTRMSLMQGRDAAEQWIAASRAMNVPSNSDTDAARTRDAQVAIATGYLERLRLGLGSPFRLIDYALQDPRLPDPVRHTLAWSLLARTLDGEAYQIDPAALDRAGVARIPSWPGIGRRHLSLIDRTVSAARDPRAGELAVRLAYAIAASEGSLPQHAPKYADNAAALIRDRELARRDAAALLRGAEAQHIDAMILLQRWRAERRMTVEAPALGALSHDDELYALQRVDGVTDELRDIASDVRNITASHPARVAVHASLLSDAAAQRLAMQAASLPMPPLAPIVVGVRGYHRELVAQPWLDDRERELRNGLETAGSEERFVAQYAQIERTKAWDVVPSLAMMWGAVGMRAMAQEAVWYPGYPAPSSRDLVQRYGLAGISFAPSVPAEWQPYYRRMIDVALSDMRTVLPSMNVRGLSVRFQEVGREAGTLALHEPDQRRLLLPPSTAGGTLAHEIAHDIDWQVSLRRYHMRGDYASDRAVRYGSDTGDRLALRMQDLAVGSTASAPTSAKLAAHDRRPTEILARHVDFFVTTALAGKGIVDGYLSSVQDEVLTGYGTVRAPELTGVAADALMNILDEIAPAGAAARGRFLRNYGSGRSLGSYDLARTILETDLPTATPSTALNGAMRDSAAFAAIARARVTAANAIDAGVCRSPGGMVDGDLEQARRELVFKAAAARARGYTIRTAHAAFGAPAGAWARAQFAGGPWNVAGVSPAVQSWIGSLVQSAREVGTSPDFTRSEGFRLSSPAAGCAALAISAG